MADQMDAYEKYQKLMAIVHLGLQNGLEHIVGHLQRDQKRIQSGQPSALQADLTTWLAYVTAWDEMLMHHHDAEEKCIFPQLRAKGIDMEDEKEAHEVIHATLDKILALLQGFKKDHSTYDGTRLLTLLEKVKGPLLEHLDQEVEKLGREHLKPHIDEKELTVIFTAADQYAKKHAPTAGLPFLFHHWSPQQKAPLFSKMPFMFTYGILPAVNLATMRLWKYAPYKLYN